MGNHRTNSVLFRIQKFFAVLAALVLVSIGGLYLYLWSLEGKKATPMKIGGTEYNQPIYFAHRGGAREAPENTMAAFEKAAGNGVDVLELDVRVTKDGELVVIHDEGLARTTDGNGPVRNFDLSDLKTLDAGYDFSEDGGKTFPYRGKGVKIPALREVLEEFPLRLINIEIKDADPGLAGKVCGLVRETDREERVIVASTKGGVIDEFRKSCSGVATSASFSEALWFVFLYKIGLSENYSADMQALQVPERLFGINLVTQDFLAAARERKLKIHIWTSNERSEMKRLIDAGVDGVMTDRPSLVRSVRREWMGL